MKYLLTYKKGIKNRSEFHKSEESVMKRVEELDYEGWKNIKIQKL